MEYITYNAGYNIWLVEKFNSLIDWHNLEYKGSYKDCKEEANYQMEQANKSYNDDDYLIG